MGKHDCLVFLPWLSISDCLSSPFISQTPLIFTGTLYRTSSLLLSTLNRHLETALKISLCQLCLFYSLFSSQCTLIFLSPSGQWSRGSLPISFLQMHPLVQILITACIFHQLFSWSLPISWAWSGEYCYLPSCSAGPCPLLHTEQRTVKSKAGHGRDRRFFLIVSKLKKIKHYLQLRGQDSHQGVLPLLTWNTTSRPAPLSDQQQLLSILISLEKQS